MRLPAEDTGVLPAVAAAAGPSEPVEAGSEARGGLRPIMASLGVRVASLVVG
jgi:hypothetical protein